jgi:hypothetical protein
LRHKSLADVPAACSFNLDNMLFGEPVLRIVCLLDGEQNPNLKSGAFSAEQSPASLMVCQTFPDMA